ncbi:MAG: isoprenylcysteine carboxylmethyltransferase family protein [Gammaproteobacteria bacterium]|nr:isoprenylcysteine carboxylmethyltransferase family protein [Gammaproteobacteria bacterium]
MNKIAIHDEKLDKPLPLWLILIIPFYAGGIMALCIFPVSGDWNWFEGWAYTISFAINIGISYAIINQKNPRVLRNRAKLKKEGLTDATRKSAGSDFIILPIMGIGFLGAIFVPGLEHRFGGMALPFALIIAGLVLSNTGSVIMSFAMLQNPFASKLLDINKDQVLVDTGLYAYVRHPMYSGAVLMIIPLPIALSSWWGLIPAFVAVLSILIRIQPEEAMLLAGMDGYKEYKSRIKYKLIPGVY